MSGTIQHVSKKEDTSQKKETLGITHKKATDFSDWYHEIVQKANLIDYTDISGCFVLKPNSISIWKHIQNYINSHMQAMNVEEAYFPCFVTRKALEKESSNFDGFKAEVAWIKYKEEDQEEKKEDEEKQNENQIAVRPTSEAIIYPLYSKWIRSHADLPMKLNQWCSVVRLEAKRCMPFIRTKELLWQEAHSVFHNKTDADAEVLQVLNMYEDVYVNLLAIPVIKGRKTEAEKFAGADYTTTIETFIPESGRSIQAATAHYLGQGFAKAFDITYKDINHDNQYVHQTSWGLSTRSIGTMIMVHGDDKGLRLPPKVAKYQIVIIPIYRGKNIDIVNEYARGIESMLKNRKIRVHLDLRDYNPGWKYNDWELQGVPVRIHVGEKDIKNNTIEIFRRDLNKKYFVNFADFDATKLLQEIHDTMYQQALLKQEESMKKGTTMSDYLAAVEHKYKILLPFCGAKECENTLEVGKSSCVPFNQPDINHDCFICGKKATVWCWFGMSF
ncbi:Prolyl-tRNA synthetase [uncultured virus]|nr:Prolyl-tRNA synthetase [uncultured virus]